MGIDPIISPVLDINFRARIDADLTDVQALIFTSANGAVSYTHLTLPTILRV